MAGYGTARAEQSNLEDFKILRTRSGGNAVLSNQPAGSAPRQGALTSLGPDPNTSPGVGAFPEHSGFLPTTSGAVAPAGRRTVRLRRRRVSGQKSYARRNLAWHRPKFARSSAPGGLRCAAPSPMLAVPSPWFGSRLAPPAFLAVRKRMVGPTLLNPSRDSRNTSEPAAA
jgi:hypothetical protein